MHWLAMKLRAVIPATELFATFRGRVLDAVPPPSIAELIPEIAHDAKIMRSFDDQEPGTVEAVFFERLAALDTSTVIPLVLYLFRDPAVSAEKRQRCLRMLESWLVRRMLMGLTAKNYNQQVPVIISRVADDPEFADEVILEELRTGVGQISRWPTDDELRSRLTEQPLYGWVRQDRVAMTLAAVEETLYTNKVEAIAGPKKLSIEHVLPQSWEENWALPDGDDPEAREAAATERNDRIHRIGNLTIVTQPLNAALSNAPWDVKSRELNRNSKLLLNARLTEEYAGKFDEASIDQRGEWLAARIISVWPGPDSWS
jgi:hypothetical protein